MRSQKERFFIVFFKPGNIRIPFYKRLASYFYPMRIVRGKSDYNDFLEILLYHNQLQLVTSDALYSDGDRYRPATEVAKALRSHLPHVKRLLVLGTGLGSMVRVLRRKGCHPKCTLVELDKAVLNWAVELMPPEVAGNITPICGDGGAFMERNTDKYDLIFIDIFNGRVVPDFVCTLMFLKQCRDALAPGGFAAFNYIVNDEQQWQAVQRTFKAVFPKHEVRKMSINRILIGGVD